jgi:hypothetical protein
VVKKKIAAALVSSTEAFPMVGLALQVEVLTAVATIRGLKVGEECWNSSSLCPARGGGGHIEACLAMGDPPHGISVLDPYENPVT